MIHTTCVKACTSGLSASVGACACAGFLVARANLARGGMASAASTRPHVYRLASSAAPLTAHAPIISPCWISRRLIDDDPHSLSRRTVFVCLMSSHTLSFINSFIWSLYWDTGFFYVREWLTHYTASSQGCRWHISSNFKMSFTQFFETERKTLRTLFWRKTVREIGFLDWTPKALFHFGYKNWHSNLYITIQKPGRFCNNVFLTRFKSSDDEIKYTKMSA